MTTKEQPHGTFEANGKACCNWCGQPVNDPVRNAADDLLAACEAIIRCGDEYDWHKPEMVIELTREEYDRLHAAIAKARHA